MYLCGKIMSGDLKNALKISHRDRHVLALPDKSKQNCRYLEHHTSVYFIRQQYTLKEIRYQNHLACHLMCVMNCSHLWRSWTEMTAVVQETGREEMSSCPPPKRRLRKKTPPFPSIGEREEVRFLAPEFFLPKDGWNSSPAFWLWQGNHSSTISQKIFWRLKPFQTGKTMMGSECRFRHVWGSYLLQGGKVNCLHVEKIHFLLLPKMPPECTLVLQEYEENWQRMHPFVVFAWTEQDKQTFARKGQ